MAKCQYFIFEMAQIHYSYQLPGVWYILIVHHIHHHFNIESLVPHHVSAFLGKPSSAYMMRYSKNKYMTVIHIQKARLSRFCAHNIRRSWVRA